MLANLRGDLGGDNGVGCSDLGWRRDRAFIAHNEDGAPALDGRFMFLTLAVDGDPAVFAQWYPGFVPSNALVVTGRASTRRSASWPAVRAPVPSPARSVT